MKGSELVARIHGKKEPPKFTAQLDAGLEKPL